MVNPAGTEKGNCTLGEVCFSALTLCAVCAGIRLGVWIERLGLDRFSGASTLIACDVIRLVTLKALSSVRKPRLWEGGASSDTRS